MGLGRGHSVACSSIPPLRLNASPATLLASPPLRRTHRTSYCRLRIFDRSYPFALLLFLALLCLCEMAATALDTRPDVSSGCSCCAALHIFRAKGTVVLRMLSVLRAMTHSTHVYGYKRHYSFMGTVCDLLSIAPSTVPTVSVATVHNTLCVLKSPSRTDFTRLLDACTLVSPWWRVQWTTH